MRIYLKGYYGYQNLGDELLLLGLLNWIENKYHPSKVYIEAGSPQFLSERLDKCQKFVKTDSDKILCVSKTSFTYRKGTFKIFGGGEVVTDARAFPWNGRNYLLGYFGDVLTKNYSMAGGIGTPKKIGTNLLYRFLLGRAQSITLRDETSYTIAQGYNPGSELYHDFCYDLLQQVEPKKPKKKPYILVNVNKYLWDETVVDTIRQTVSKYASCDVYFLPAARGSDDLLFKELSQYIPALQMLDRRTLSVEEIVGWISGAEHVLAARLHVLLITQWAGVSFTPFVYQEKIEKCILQGSNIT